MMKDADLAKCLELANAYAGLRHPTLNCVTVRGLSEALGCSAQTVSSTINRGIYNGWLEITDHWQGLPGDGPGIDNDRRYEVLTLRFNI